MFKFKDRILLGIATGIICGVPGRMLNTLEYHTRTTDAKYGQMAANLFLPKNLVNTKEGRVIGSITNQTMLGMTGILVTYLLSATGRDKAMIKGLGVGTSLWITIYGLSSRLNLSVKSKKPLSPLLSFIDHAIFGSLCGLFASKLGHDSLFPDINIKNAKDKLPLASYKKTDSTSAESAFEQQDTP